MATKTLTIAGTPPASIVIQVLSAEQAKTTVAGGNVGLFDSRKKSWEGKGQLIEGATLGGVKVTFYNLASDPHYAMKKAQTGVALAQIQGQTGYALPGNVLDVYCHNLNQACLGYLLLDKMRNWKAVLILGTAASDKKSAGLVGDAVYEYYKPTFSVNALQKKCLAAVFHELGHVFHQIQNPSDYNALGQLGIMAGKVASELSDEKGSGPRYAATFAMAPDNTSLERLKAFQKAISTLARRVSSYATRHPNEFVAETFAALVMGVPLDQDIVSGYLAVGGPVVSQGMCHVRTGQNWFKKNVLYPMSTPIFSIGDH